MHIVFFVAPCRILLVKMIPAVCFFICFGVIFVESHPTMYKINENKVLEPDLVPVSSTVIPLPVYQVGYGFNLGSTLKDEKAKKPDGPITLITVHSKKPYPVPKEKPSDVSALKPISKPED